MGSSGGLTQLETLHPPAIAAYVGGFFATLLGVAILLEQRRYSGRWTRSAYQRNLDSLRAAVVADGYVPVGAPRFARYDPPFKPWFLRRNEVIQDVTR
jgi:hypothetical protein